jgi:hypothetical protein
MYKCINVYIYISIYLYIYKYLSSINNTNLILAIKQNKSYGKIIKPYKKPLLQYIFYIFHIKLFINLLIITCIK